LEGFMTTKEAASKWNISVRQVQNHCKNGRIKGVQTIGNNYVIPIDAKKPVYTRSYVEDETK
jgi:excisionase family DNA binding protein